MPLIINISKTFIYNKHICLFNKLSYKRFMFTLKKAAENLKDKNLNNYLNLPIYKKKISNIEPEFVTALTHICKNEAYILNVSNSLKQAIEKKTIRDFYMSIIKINKNPKDIVEHLMQNNIIQNICSSREQKENIINTIDELLTLNYYPFNILSKELIGKEGWNACYYQTGQLYPDFRLKFPIEKFFDAKINTIKKQNHLIPLKLYIKDNKIFYYNYLTNLSFKKFITFKLHALYNLETQNDKLSSQEKLIIFEYTNLLKQKNKSDLIEILWSTQEIQNIYYLNNIYYNSPIFCIQIETQDINPELLQNNHKNIYIEEKPITPKYIKHLFIKYKNLIKFNEDYFKGHTDVIMQHDADIISLIQKTTLP